MKNKSTVVVISLALLLALVGVASATTDWNGDNIFNGTVNWFKKGIRIGEQGSGGVTFFNGTIVNETTTDGTDNPVTFGDNVRIDGEIWRGENAGPGDNMPVKINDDLTIAGSLSGVGIDDIDNLRTDLTYLNDSKLATTGGAVSGDLSQSFSADGIVKGAVYFNPGEGVVRSFGIEVLNVYPVVTGVQQLTFDTSLSNRYFSITPVVETDDINRTACVGGLDDAEGKVLEVRCYDFGTGAYKSSAYNVIIF